MKSQTILQVQSNIYKALENIKMFENILEHL